MRASKLSLIGGMLLFFAAISSAQMQMPKPAPELKQMDWMVGKWKLEGDVKPSPMGPGGKMTMTEDIDWMGDFFLVQHSHFSGAGMGEGTGISILGYDSDAKKFTYNEFNSWGEAGKSLGTVDGKTWTWLGEDPKMGKGKFTMTITSPTSYDFQYDMSPDGNNWTTIMNGKATKVK